MMTTPADVLTLLAEVSVAVAGFAGIMGAIARPADELARSDLKALVQGAVAVLFFSLLPLVVGLVGVEAPTLWRIVAGLLAAYVIWYYATNLVDLTLVVSSPRWATVAGGDLLMLLALLGVTFGGEFFDRPVVYVGSLLWILLQTLVFFAVAMSGLWKDPSRAGNA